MINLNPTLSIEVIRRWSDFEALAEPWNNLLASSAADSVFLTHQWFAAFIQAFDLHNRLRIILVFDADRLVGILPLYRPRLPRPFDASYVLKSITNEHSQKFCFIIKNGWENLYPGLLPHLRVHLKWDLIQTDFVSENSFMFQRAVQPPIPRRDIKKTALMESPRILLHNGWEQYLRQHLSRSFRKKIGRMTRRCQKQYGLTYTTVSGSRFNEGHLESAYAIENNGWKGRQGTSILQSEQVRQFYSLLAESMNRRGWFELRFLNLDDRPVAFEYSLRYKGCDNSLKAGYEESFAKLSPGHLLTMFSLKRDFEKKLHVYDMLGWADSYKLRFSNSVDPLYCLYHFNRGALSRTMKFVRFDTLEIAAKLGIKNLLKQARDRFKPGIERE